MPQVVRSYVGLDSEAILGAMKLVVERESKGRTKELRSDDQKYSPDQQNNVSDLITQVIEL